MSRGYQPISKGSGQPLPPPKHPSGIRPDDDPAEAAYWRFDARRKGYGEWKETPQSERDAFKAEYRLALAKGIKE